MLGERIISLDRVTINVIDVGDMSPALIFLHYWGGSSRTWLPVVESLAETNRCIAIDSRGWGKSSRESADYDLETLCDDVLGVVDQLGLQPFIIVGHSMGAKVAQLVVVGQFEYSATDYMAISTACIPGRPQTDPLSNSSLHGSRGG